MKVEFNGVTKLIVVNPGVTDITVKTDIYSDWKEWLMVSDNSKFLEAISSVGGDPLPGGDSLGATYFLENGWKIRPQESSHTLVVRGNLFCRDGSSPYVSTIGTYNVRIESRVSNLVDTLPRLTQTEISAAVPTTNQIATEVMTLAEPLLITEDDVFEAVWNRSCESPNPNTHQGHLALALGLSKHNFKVSNIIYNIQGKATSATVKLFHTVSDMENNLPMKTYSVYSSYDNEGHMTSYEMREIV